jgi:molybdopterin-guanine dinucleotide biosynthesis protein A
VIAGPDPWLQGPGCTPTGATAVVLVGGRSRRFGGDKAAAMVGGRPVIARVLDTVRAVCRRVIVVSSAEGLPGLRLPADVEVVADEYPGTGPLGGICTGLRRAACDRALVVGADMPFLNRALLGLMAQLEGYDAVVPRRSDGHLQPLHAVYAPACLPAMEARLARGELAVWPVLREVRTRYLHEAEYTPLDPEGLSFFNLNTPADLERARRLAAEREAPASG